LATNKIVLLGVGQTASWVEKLAPYGTRFYGTTRDAAKASDIKNKGIAPILISPWQDEVEAKLAECCKGSDVLVSFPPDGETDERLARLCSNARSIIYISSTGVYGQMSGVIDESTEVDATNPNALERLKAEKTWLEIGASVLRAPGLYDSQSGLHKRLLAGTYKMPGNGENFVSRIHLKDLGRIILACFEKPLPRRSIYLVGDLKPTTHKEVVAWLCEKLNIPLPPAVPPDEVSPTLRGNRQISSKKILQDLDLQIEFPTYKEGYLDCLKQLTSQLSG
jgi:nucleoside-diphosphate-sugar epimerase